MKFIDEVHIVVSSGHGGPGAISFRREAMTPRGGPDGGDGGRGGDAIFKVDIGINSLMDYNPGKKYAAQAGVAGSSANSSGKGGESLVLKVPRGTLIKNEEGIILQDMALVEEFVVAKGGRGGKGNAFFKTSVNQAPEKAQPGEPGETLSLKLELKLLADVGIIGFPNAGKSTLISRISAAKPKIGDYPFTTLTPQLGVVRWGDEHSYIVADIPGLIEGASEGAGLGIQFLRHIERTEFFVHLIDISFADPPQVLHKYEQINHELQMYDEKNKDKDEFVPLSTRPQMVVFNKIDSVSAEDLEKIVKHFVQKTKLKPSVISAYTGLKIEDLKNEIGHRLFDKKSGSVE